MAAETPRDSSRKEGEATLALDPSRGLSDGCSVRALASAFTRNLSLMTNLYATCCSSRGHDRMCVCKSRQQTSAGGPVSSPPSLDPRSYPDGTHDPATQGGLPQPTTCSLFGLELGQGSQWWTVPWGPLDCKDFLIITTPHL